MCELHTSNRSGPAIASVPGVSIVAVGINATPPNTGAVEDSFNFDGNSNREQLQARVMLVSQQYFAALHIPLVQGRIWNADENLRGDFIAVVNRAFAARYLSSSNALGRQLRIPDLTPWGRFTVTSAQSTAWRQIIGVVGDARNDGVDRSVVPAIYLPYTTVMQPFVQFLRPHAGRSAYSFAFHPCRYRIRRIRSDEVSA